MVTKGIKTEKAIGFGRSPGCEEVVSLDKKESFLLYHDYDSIFAPMPDELAGMLIKAIIRYAKTGEREDFDELALKMAYSYIVARMDKDAAKYEERCERNKKNGAKGGKAKAANAKKDLANVANASERYQPLEVASESSRYDIDIDIDNDNDINKNIVQISEKKSANAGASTSATDPRPAECNEIFERLWKLYPVKRGKGSVSTTQKRTIAKIGEDEMTRAIERYKADVQTAGFDLNYKNGSTFFNSGYVDYLDANYTPRQRPPKTTFGGGRSARTIENRCFADNSARNLNVLEE